MYEIDFMYLTYENIGVYFSMKMNFLYFIQEIQVHISHENGIFYILCMKIQVFTFIELTDLLFFKQKNNKFTIIYNDTKSYNFGLVNCEFHLDFEAQQFSNFSLLQCFRITWRAYELKLSDARQFQSFCFSRFADLNHCAFCVILLKT